MIIMADKKRGPAIDAILGPEEEDKEGGNPLHTCVSELIDSVHAKDVEGAADALKACFAQLDSDDHEEGEHTEDY